ncbi:MAG: hypothetical protein K0S81_942 [Rhodospirillales bacterium]|nr:hypothetical protein [Rhodospirillales bacterium]
MSAMAEQWSEPRSRAGLSFSWWSAAAAGGLAGGLLPDPLLAAAVASALVGLLQALAFRPDLRYGAAWSGATTLAGAVGFGAMVIGATAFAEVAGAEPALVREGLLAWLGLGALGGLLLAAAQAPLTGRPGLAAAWCILGIVGGGILWPAGYAIGRRYGPELAASIAEAAPQLSFLAAEPVGQAAAFALAWLLHSFPFGLLVASRSGGER